MFGGVGARRYEAGLFSEIAIFREGSEQSAADQQLRGFVGIAWMASSKCVAKHVAGGSCGGQGAVNVLFVRVRHPPTNLPYGRRDMSRKGHRLKSVLPKEGPPSCYK